MMQLLLPTSCPRTVDAAPTMAGNVYNGCEEASVISKCRTDGLFVIQLGLAIGVESCCCQKKCLGDSAKKVEYWFWQQKRGDYFVCERGSNSCLQTPRPWTQSGSLMTGTVPHP